MAKNSIFETIFNGVVGRVESVPIPAIFRLFTLGYRAGIFGTPPNSSLLLISV